VLAEVARRLAGAVRSGELMGRIGGEEFAWLMPEATPDGAHAAAERVRASIQDTPFDAVGTLTLSVGVCSNQQAATADELVGRADEALYWSKAGGRNMTSVYSATELKRQPPARKETAGRGDHVVTLPSADVVVNGAAQGAGNRRSSEALGL